MVRRSYEKSQNARSCQVKTEQFQQQKKASIKELKVIMHQLLKNKKSTKRTLRTNRGCVNAIKASEVTQT